MSEKVAKLGIPRDRDYMYFVKGGNVWRVRRKIPGQPKGRQEQVADAGVVVDSNYVYFVDKAGDVSRAPRAIGGQARKKARKATPGKKPRKAAARKPARKAGRTTKAKSAKAGAKRAGKRGK